MTLDKLTSTTCRGCGEHASVLEKTLDFENQCVWHPRCWTTFTRTCGTLKKKGTT